MKRDDKGATDFMMEIMVLMIVSIVFCYFLYSYFLYIHDMSEIERFMDMDESCDGLCDGLLGWENITYKGQRGIFDWERIDILNSSTDPEGQISRFFRSDYSFYINISDYSSGDRTNFKFWNFYDTLPEGYVGDVIIEHRPVAIREGENVYRPGRLEVVMWDAE